LARKHCENSAFEFFDHTRSSVSKPSVNQL
jgi:hypothetical protein